MDGFFCGSVERNRLSEMSMSRKFGCCVLLLAAVVPLGCASNSLMRSVEEADARQQQREADRAARESARSVAFIPENRGDGGPVDVMIVNGEKITVDDVLGPIRANLAKSAKSLPPDRYRSLLSAAIQNRVRSLARDALLFHEAGKNLLEEEENQIDGLVDQEIRKRVNVEFDGRQTRFEKHLAGMGLTLREERERVRRGILVVRWLQLKIHRNINDPTREELWETFQQNRDSFAKPPRRKMQIIELSVESFLTGGATSKDPASMAAAREAARVAAVAARERIVGGESFSSVAGEVSTSWHKASGGAFGWVTHGSVREGLEPAVDALFALEGTGVPSDIVETDGAFFIVQAAEIDPGVEPDFATLQPELVDKYRGAQFDKLVDEQIARLQENAHIQPENINRFLEAVALAAPK
jgi:PPIC-type PPIASE domain